ncbi:MAG: VWA domain-containing protein [Spirochaetes bacterium]|nr:VWA domain-containing protein [Spirochaetota bacterium]
MNETIGFAQPWVLAFLAVLIPMIAFDIFGKQGKRARLLSGGLKNKLFISSFFFKLFVACAIIALAGPRWGYAPARADNRRGLDIVFAIDLSRSMDILDVPGANNTEVSRLERALALAKEAVAAAPGSRHAVAIGKGSAVLAIPLTWSYETVLAFLEELDSASITGWGTNLEALVMAAAGAFHASFLTRQTIILISDGEATLGDFSNALNYSARRDISVIAVAVGSDEGRPAGTASTAGHISSRDAAVMRNAAEQTGGIYIDGNASDAAAVLAAHLSSLSGGFAPAAHSLQQERRSMFVIIAVAIYAMSKFAPMAPARRKQWAK